jgi:hypothetical protein
MNDVERPAVCARGVVRVIKGFENLKNNMKGKIGRESHPLPCAGGEGLEKVSTFDILHGNKILVVDDA